MVDLNNIIWWIGALVFFVLLWQIAKSLQSVSVTFRKFEEFVKKFENFSITELLPSPSAAPVAPVAPPALTPPSVPAPAPAPAAGDSIPGEIVAVIAAAVDAVIAGPHRILSINPVAHLGGPNPYQTALAWSAEGRRHIFQSHKLR